VPSIAEGNFCRPGGFHHLTFRIDPTQAVHGMRDGDVDRQVVLITHHHAEFFLGNELNRFDAEACPENSIESGRCPAALKVAKDACANLLSGAFSDFGADDLSDAAEACSPGRGVAMLPASWGGTSATTIIAPEPRRRAA
jgi:hypothetical protein